MTTIEENEIRRLSLQITRAATIMSQPYAISSRRMQAEEIIENAKKAERILKGATEAHGAGNGRRGGE